MGFVNIDTDLVDQIVGQQIEYYELWDNKRGAFRRGCSHIHGIYNDSESRQKLYADTIWGDSLDGAYFDEEGLLIFEDQSYIYLAPTPFRIYRITYRDKFDTSKEILIPAESETDRDIIAKAITNGRDYVAIRVNLDGSTYQIF
jgi:hypothetical protein